MFSSLCCRRWLLPGEARHDVQPAAAGRQHAAGLQGGQAQPGLARYATLSPLRSTQPPTVATSADLRVSARSVLHQLRPVHLLRARLRLHLRQHRQRRLGPDPGVLRRGVQPAGGRQVRVDVTGGSREEFLSAAQMFLCFCLTSGSFNLSHLTAAVQLPS